MKLVTIWNAREAFATLGALKKAPKVAYRLMKYERKFMAEVDACQKQQDACIYAALGKNPACGERVSVEPGTPEHNTFVTNFIEFLATESDLGPVDMTMEALIEALGAEQGNALSERDLMLLEPFFQE